MLHHLFSMLGVANVTTIALAADGIAICENGKSPKMLASADTRYESRAALVNALQSVTSHITAKRVRFVVSNHFVRYGVLPWQTGITARQDWLALAQHDYRKRFGAIADQWQLCVSFNGYGKTVVTSAIDQALVDDLRALAESNSWKITSIEPLLMRILTTKKTTGIQRKQNSWLVVAEPERVLLCETNQQEWQRFTLISPPSGQEAIQTTQQIMRSIQSKMPLDTKTTQQKPTEVIAFLAPSLMPQRQEWAQALMGSYVSIHFVESTGYQPDQTNSALWMASL